MIRPFVARITQIRVKVKRRSSFGNAACQRPPLQRARGPRPLHLTKVAVSFESGLAAYAAD
jgi:hypothetical protein